MNIQWEVGRAFPQRGKMLLRTRGCSKAQSKLGSILVNLDSCRSQELENGVSQKYLILYLCGSHVCWLRADTCCFCVHAKGSYSTLSYLKHQCMSKEMQHLQGNVYWELSQQEASLSCAMQNLGPSCYKQMPQELSTESQNHQIIQTGRDLQDHLFQPSTTIIIRKPQVPHPDAF